MGNGFSIGKDPEQFDLSKIGIGQRLEVPSKISDSQNELRNMSEEEISVFNAIDTDGNGTLSRGEIDNVLQEVSGYTEDGNLSKREARRIANKLGVNTRALMSFLQKLCGISERVESTDNGDGATTVREVVSTARDEVSGDNRFYQETIYNNENGEVVGYRTYNSRDCDESGNPIIFSKLNPEGKFLEKRTRLNDGSVRTIYYDGNRHVTSVETSRDHHLERITLDANGKYANRTMTNEEGFVERDETTYDNGKPTLRSIKFRDNATDTRNYHENRRVSSRVIVTPDNYTLTLEYDEEGRQSSVKITDENGENLFVNESVLRTLFGTYLRAFPGV